MTELRRWARGGQGRAGAFRHDVLLISGLTALVPARQAMRTHPVEALRLERKSGSFAG